MRTTGFKINKIEIAYLLDQDNRMEAHTA